MWASIAHLIFGNAIIGVIEGLLLAGVFKCPMGRSILLLIAANYASSWLGGYLVVDWLASLPDIILPTLKTWFLLFVGVAFLVTLLIEFPFVWFALRSRALSWRRVAVATLAIHGVSYALLSVWYGLASGTSMMTRLRVVTPEEMNLPVACDLYFLSPEGERVIMRKLEAPDAREVVAAVTAPHPNDRLFVWPRPGSGFDLMLHLDEEERDLPVIRNFSDQASVDWRISEGHAEKAVGSWSNFGPVPLLGSASGWEFHTGFWAVEGISGNHQPTGEKVRFSLELPFVAWVVRNAVQLEGGYVVAQLGDDQICLFHPDSRRVALIARGKGPVVAKRSTTTKQP